MRRWIAGVGTCVCLADCSSHSAVSSEAAVPVGAVGAGSDVSIGVGAAFADVVIGADVATLADVDTDASPHDVLGPNSDADDASGIDASADVTLTCEELQAKIDALKPTLTACTVEQGCTTYMHATCNVADCFQAPVAQGSDTSLLEALTLQAGAQGCESYWCGCTDWRPSFCLKGQCRQCPPDCDGTCEEITGALTELAHTANQCEWDFDCVIVSTGICQVDDLPCGGLVIDKFINTFVSGTMVQAVVGGYKAACGPSTCDCALPSALACVKGKCVPK